MSSTDRPQRHDGADDGRDHATDTERLSTETRRHDPDLDRPARRRLRRGVVGVPHVGTNWGAAFFGWVTAMGLAVLLTALAAAIGAAIGVTRGASVADTANQLSQDPRGVGMVSGIVLGVVVLVSYYCGGYVAARMSRFEGGRQGFAVWLWAVIIAVVVAILAVVAGAKYDVLSSLNSFPRIPVKQGDLTSGGIIALVAFLVVSLVGALLGGRAGMHYHRQLDRFDPTLEE